MAMHFATCFECHGTLDFLRKENGGVEFPPLLVHVMSSGKCGAYLHLKLVRQLEAQVAAHRAALQARKDAEQDAADLDARDFERDFNGLLASFSETMSAGDIGDMMDDYDKERGAF